MGIQDPIADMLVRINNAQRNGHDKVLMPSSRLKMEIARVLQEEGYITGYALDEATSSDKKPVLCIVLKYFDKKPVIKKIKRVSSPGLRVYLGSKEMPKVQGGMGTAIVTTSSGVMTALQASLIGQGGEVLCYILE